MRDWPVLILAIVVWCYWLGVLCMVIRTHRREHRAAGIVPRHGLEKAIWWIWVPGIVAWNVLPALALRKNDKHLLALPQWALEPWALNLRSVVAGVLVLGLAATIVCWVKLGKNWSIAVLPGEKTQLVTSGPYRWVRHPIYALSGLMMVCSLLILPTIPMAIIAAVHLALLNVKARNEERFLVTIHGDAYQRYQRAVGRFLPMGWGRSEPG